MNIVFCADRRVLPGLHVAAFSLLERMNPDIPLTRFYVFNNDFTEADFILLNKSLSNIQKPFSLENCYIDFSQFKDLRQLNNSWATYYRLLIPQILDVNRFLYIDVDTLCDVDVSELNTFNLKNTPVGWVRESPLALSVDRKVAEVLGNSQGKFYHNSGVLLVDVENWRRHQITERAINYIMNNHVAFHDQSALNILLHSNSTDLNEKYNIMANMRKHWPKLKRQYGNTGSLIHFVDYPKPWSFLAEFSHPQFEMWRSVRNKTEMKNYRSWKEAKASDLHLNSRLISCYLKSLKDRMLYFGYSKHIFNYVKGVPLENQVSRNH